jgi:YD repeat-containing protein
VLKKNSGLYFPKVEKGCETMLKKILLTSLLISFCMYCPLIAADVEICCVIKPDSDSKPTCPCSTSTINPESKGVIPVAIFTTDSLVDTGCPDFDVAQIDVETICFGSSQAKVKHFDTVDIDSDNDLDMIVHFQTQETGIKHGDTTVELTGLTIDGLEFHYQGLIRTVPKKGGKTVHPSFTPYINPNDPLILTVNTPSGEYIEYFGHKDAEGFATEINLVRVTDAGGNTTTISLDGQGRPARILGFNGTVFEITWQSNSLILVTAISADGSIQVNVSIDLIT